MVQYIGDGKLNYIVVEDICSKCKNKLKRYAKADFAKAMNCPVYLLDNLDALTQKVFGVKENDPLVGNVGCKYCGRSDKNKTIWTGLLFDRPVGHKLAVGFCVCAPKHKKDAFPKNTYIDINNLLSAYYNYYAEYTEIDGGYWFFVFLDCSIENKKSVSAACREMKKIINDVVPGAV